MQSNVIIVKLSCSKRAAREKCIDSDELPVKRLLIMAKSSIGSIGVEMYNTNGDSLKQYVSGAIATHKVKTRKFWRN